MRAGVIGFDAESHPIGSDRGVVLALLIECSAEVAVGLAIIRLDPQRFAIRHDGLVELAHVEERSAKVAMAIRSGGCQADYLATRGRRRLEIAPCKAGIAEIGEVVRIVSVQTYSLADQVNGHLIAPHLQGHHPQ